MGPSEPEGRDPRGGGGDEGPPRLDPETVVDRYGERIYALARRLTGNDADAEDVTQNTLLKVVQRADTFRGESAPMGWIYRITVNEARELFRHQRRRPAVSLDALPVRFDESGHAREPPRDFTSRPDRRARAREVEQRVRTAIEELPPEFREALVLVDLHGLPYAEAAQIVELSLGGFKTRLHRARLHLRNRLEAFWASLDAGEDGGEGS